MFTQLVHNEAINTWWIGWESRYRNVISWWNFLPWILPSKFGFCFFAFFLQTLKLVTAFFKAQVKFTWWSTAPATISIHPNPTVLSISNCKFECVHKRQRERKKEGKKETRNEITWLIHLHPYKEVKCCLILKLKITSINFSRTFGCNHSFTNTFLMKNI